MRGAHVRDMRTGEAVEIRADITVSAAGAWAGRIAAMAGLTVTVRGGRGIMIALNHRLVHAVVNRCRMPADADILVPAHTVSVIGTTDSPVEDPDDFSHPAGGGCAGSSHSGAEMVPHMREARMLRVWAGIRPLYSEGPEGASTRDITRDLRVARPPRARGRRRPSDHHRRQAHHLPAHGRGDRRRGLRAPRRRGRLPHGAPSRCPAPRTARPTTSATAWPLARATSTTSR